MPEAQLSEYEVLALKETGTVKIILGAKWPIGQRFTMRSEQFFVEVADIEMPADGTHGADETFLIAPPKVYTLKVVR